MEPHTGKGSSCIASCPDLFPLAKAQSCKWTTLVGRSHLPQAKVLLAGRSLVEQGSRLQRTFCKQGMEDPAQRLYCRLHPVPAHKQRVWKMFQWTGLILQASTENSWRCALSLSVRLLCRSGATINAFGPAWKKAQRTLQSSDKQAAVGEQCHHSVPSSCHTLHARFVSGLLPHRTHWQAHG